MMSISIEETQEQEQAQPQEQEQEQIQEDEPQGLQILGKDLPVITVPAIITHMETWTETEIHGGGVHGAHSGGYGYVGGGKISSRSTNFRRIVAETVDGRNFTYTYGANHLVLKEGQQVFLAFRKKKANLERNLNDKQFIGVLNKGGECVFTYSKTKFMKPKLMMLISWLLPVIGLSVFFGLFVILEQTGNEDKAVEDLYGQIGFSIFSASLVLMFILRFLGKRIGNKRFNELLYDSMNDLNERKNKY